MQRCLQFLVRWSGLLFQTAFLLAFSAYIVSPPVASATSWRVFAVEWGVRTAIVLVFVIATRAVLSLGTVNNYPITSELEGSETGTDLDELRRGHARFARPMTAKARFKVRAVIALWLSVPLLSLAFDWHNYRGSMHSPQVVIALLGALFNASCFAFLAALAFGAWFTRKAHMVEDQSDQEKWKWSWRELPAIILIAMVALPILVPSAPQSFCLVACVGWFILLWLPKPEALPESLHVVPRAEYKGE